MKAMSVAIWIGENAERRFREILEENRSPDGFEVKNIRKKFATVIDDFLKKRFGNVFSNPKYCLNKFRLYFVSDACRIKKKFPGMTQETYRKKDTRHKI